MDEKEKLKKTGKKLVNEINKGINPSLDIPIRALSNIIFNPKTSLITIGDRSSKRYFFNVAHVKKFMQTVGVASIAKDLLEAKKHVSLRQAFYMMRRTIPGTKIDIVDEQTESNKAVEDLELITNLSREELHINANKEGTAAGKIIIKDKGDTINWAKLGSGGWSIPSNVENIQFKKVSAKFVIYMEKAAMWERLHEDKVWDKMNCAIIASQGQATRGIRRLLKRMNKELKLPIYVLTDFDPWGFYIYSVLKFGSISLAHISEKLAIPDAKFLGLTGDDVENYNLKKHVIRFKDVDKSRLKQLKKYDWFKDNKEWQRQFNLMKQLNGKVELDALVTKGISFVSEKYLPEKLKKRQFIN
ncbi:MAG: DNA topoisomerase IV subunit A [Candidatus Hodarchaeales archaeon]|jgi:DNA topoisomerase-6 subunit A